MDTTRIHPAGDPFSAKQSEPTVKCTACRQRFSRREIVVVHEGMHDNLVYFHGDKLCHRCARRNGVSY
jgi:hypothetical protein